jgi:hypothetical protein
VTYRAGVTFKGQKVFCKKYVAVRKADQELTIAEQVNDPRFVTPLGYSDEDGLISPFIDLPKLEDVPRALVADKSALRSELLALFRFATEKDIVVEYCGRKEVKLIDIIDLHPSNMFYDESDLLLRVFDLEMFSLANEPRNRMHLAKALLHWCGRDALTLGTIVACTIAYAWGLWQIALRPPERRVVERAASVPGWIYVRLREGLDKVIMALLPAFRQ